MKGNENKLLKTALERGEGVFRIFPTWVPRAFCVPGKRLKLHIDDYYAFGTHRGGIDERWFSSCTKADNGPETLEDEGLSYIYIDDGVTGYKVLLKDAIAIMGDEILGTDVMNEYGGWRMFSKFFDNMEPLPHHLHQNDYYARKVKRRSKPEAYYFPKQLNNHNGYFPYTFFGLNLNTTENDIKKCLENWDTGDNGILYLSKAYKLKLGTGWDIPAGILHAPGSLLTYEPQGDSDVFAMFQSLVWDRYMPWDFLVKDVPEEYKNDLDYIVNMIDWDLNLDANFYSNRFKDPLPAAPIEEMRDMGYEENWIAYGSKDFSAKELTIFPNRTVTVKDSEAYGVITIQGRGYFGCLSIESPEMIRFGEMTNDEVFVSVKAAENGIKIKNISNKENLVILKHFGPGNSDAP